MEFGYAEVVEFGGESVDGGECCSSRGGKDKSIGGQDVEYAFISIGIRNRKLVILCGPVCPLWLPPISRSKPPVTKTI